MKTIVAIRLFLVLCCQTDVDGNMYSYEVKELTNKDNPGILYSKAKYNVGDTIKIMASMPQITLNK